MTHLNKTLCALNCKLSDSGVIIGRTVEGGGNNLTLDGALHIGNFLGTLVNQNHHEVNLRVVGRNRVGNCLQNESLSSLWRRNNQTTLTLTNRGNQIDNSGRELLVVGLEAKASVWVERS